MALAGVCVIALKLEIINTKERNLIPAFFFEEVRPRLSKKGITSHHGGNPKTRLAGIGETRKWSLSKLGFKRNLIVSEFSQYIGTKFRGASWPGAPAGSWLSNLQSSVEFASFFTIERNQNLDLRAYLFVKGWGIGRNYCSQPFTPLPG